MGLRFFKYTSLYISIAIILASLFVAGKWIFVTPIYVFAFIPLLELVLPYSEANMSQAQEEIAKRDWKYDLVVWSVVPVQYMLLFYFLNRVGEGNLTWWEIAGSIFAFGIACGVLGINVAHELGHRNTWYEQTMSKMLLLTSLYMHFFIEHNRGHHKNVSTDEDPASSRYGESIYAFFPRTISDSWRSAWKIETDRLKKAHIPFWSLQNEMLMYQLIQLAFLGFIAAVWGWKVMLYFMAAAFIGILLLETVNYIEHYGLRRKKIDGAYYDKVLPIHSWNSDHPIGRIMLFELSRHSDHHYLPSRKYQVLRHFDKSPQMPTGYPGMMVLSYFPPLWFKVMHRQIQKYKATEGGAALA
jgi:alkane 1-monooxygenase